MQPINPAVVPASCERRIAPGKTPFPSVGADANGGQRLLREGGQPRGAAGSTPSCSQGTIFRQARLPAALGAPAAPVPGPSKVLLRRNPHPCETAISDSVAWLWTSSAGALRSAASARPGWRWGSAPLNAKGAASLLLNLTSKPFTLRQALGLPRRLQLSAAPSARGVVAVVSGNPPWDSPAFPLIAKGPQGTAGRNSPLSPLQSLPSEIARGSVEANN